MPRAQDEPPDIHGVAANRASLIESTDGVDLERAPWKLRISNVPLFRERGAILEQAIRVLSGCSSADAPTSARVRIADAVVASRSLPLDRAATSYLFVPEVTAPVAATIELMTAEGVVASVPFEIMPQRKWTVHLIHQSHYDIGYTDPQAIVLDSQLAYIDTALDLAELTDGWPDAARFRWNIEVTWPLTRWLRSRPRSAREALVRRVREGRIEVHALPFSMHTEGYSFDELARQLDAAQELRETLGIEIVSAMQTDVPGATIGLATLLTDAGIRYLSVAHNYAGRSVPYLRDGRELTRPFYWLAPDGERLLVWYTDTLSGAAYMEAMSIGFGIGYEAVRDSLPEYLNALSQNAYPYPPASSPGAPALTKTPYAHDIVQLRVQGAVADNASPSILPSEIVRTWNEEWAYPTLRLSTDRQFFEEVERRIGPALDTFHGDWTDWWADGIGSAAFALGKNRKSQADIRTAQTLHALADALTDDPNPAVPAEVTAAYEEMALFDEHTWGAANPWKRGAIGMSSGEYQWTRKAAFAYTAEERIVTLLSGGRNRIAALARPPASFHANDAMADALLVFNPSSWERTDLVRVFLPERSRDVSTCELIERSSGAVVPFIVEPQVNASHRPKGQFIRFLAHAVPPLGYARYVLSPRSGSPDTSEEAPQGASLANEHLAVELDVATASIASITDRRDGAVLNDPDAPFGFNRYIHDRYASAPGFNHLSSRIGTAGPWLLGGRSTSEYGLITSRVHNKVWDQVTIRSSGGGADWLETTVTLLHRVPRLHIVNRLHKPATMEKESVYFAFPFALDFAEPSFEITGGVASSRTPHVPGSAGHFRAIRHWATLEAAEKPPIAWATMEAPLAQVGTIHLPYAPFPTTNPERHASPSTIYSWALNNIWDTNFPAQQGGELTFRYAVAVGDRDGAASALGRDTGAAVSMPLIGVRALDYVVASSVEPDRGSILSVEHADIEITHLAPDGVGGIVVHLVSHAPEPTTTTVVFGALDVKAARVGTFLGTEMRDAEVRNGRVELEIVPGEIRTIALTTR